MCKLYAHELLVLKGEQAINEGPYSKLNISAMRTLMPDLIHQLFKNNELSYQVKEIVIELIGETIEEAYETMPFEHFEWEWPGRYEKEEE